MLTICVSPVGDTQIVNIQVRAFFLISRSVGAPLTKGALLQRDFGVSIHAWRGSTVSTKVDNYQQQKSVEGGMGPVGA